MRTIIMLKKLNNNLNNCMRKKSETPVEVVPKKKRSYNRKKPKTLIETVVSNELDNLTEIAQQELGDVFNMAVLEYCDQLEKKIHKNKQNDMEHLQRIVSEYLETFIIIGYDFSGNQCEINLSKSERDDNALTEMLKNVFIRSQMKAQMGNQDMF